MPTLTAARAKVRPSVTLATVRLITDKKRTVTATGSDLPVALTLTAARAKERPSVIPATARLITVQNRTELVLVSANSAHKRVSVARIKERPNVTSLTALSTSARKIRIVTAEVSATHAELTVSAAKTVDPSRSSVATESATPTMA